MWKTIQFFPARLLGFSSVPAATPSFPPSALTRFYDSKNCCECLWKRLSSSEGVWVWLWQSLSTPSTHSGNADVSTCTPSCVCGHKPQLAADLHRTESFTVSNYSSSVQESQPGTTDTSESHWETEMCACWVCHSVQAYCTVQTLLTLAGS